MFQTVASIGRAMFLPITAAIQASAQTKELRTGEDGRLALLQGFRAAEWFCFACMIASLGMTIFGLRNIGKIGLLKKLGHVQSDSKEKVSDV
jgi:hypothetical protein